jgi:hypothetical protein
MNGKRYSNEQIICALKRVEVGETIRDGKANYLVYELTAE